MSQKDSCIFWVKLTKANSQKLKLGIQKVWMEGPIISYVRISDDPFAQSYGGNLDPICAPNFIFIILVKLTDIYLNKVFHLEKSWGVIYRVWDGANKKTHKMS